jgi:Spy/CpxP family protein refolding chaperone
MKKFAAITAATMLGTVLTLGAFAQTPKPEKPGKPGKFGVAGRKGKEGRGMGRMGRMMGDLNLTDSQKAKIKTLSEAMATKRKAIMDDTKLSEDTKKEKMKELGKDFRAQFEKVLTPEQKTKMEAARKERREKMGKLRGAGRPGAPGAPAPKKP